MNKLVYFILSFFVIPSISLGEGLILLDSEDNEITGDTLHVRGSPDESIIKGEVFFHNNTGEDVEVLVRKEEIEILPGTMNTFCWNGLCFPPDVYEATEPIILGPGETSADDDFYAEYIPNGNSGISIINYEFFSEEDDSFEAVNVTIVFDTESTSSVELPKAPVYHLSGPAPNPATDFTHISYNLPDGASNASIVINNINGLLVKEITLDLFSDYYRLNTSSFQDGIYLYSLVIDNTVVSTKKLIISK